MNYSDRFKETLAGVYQRQVLPWCVSIQWRGETALTRRYHDRGEAEQYAAFFRMALPECAVVVFWDGESNDCHAERRTSP
jgi:hypothetical protein